MHSDDVGSIRMSLTKSERQYPDGLRSIWMSLTWEENVTSGYEDFYPGWLATGPVSLHSSSHFCSFKFPWWPSKSIRE